ncbi:LytTR family transcriptional regulator DNA-binding domain-containing protein [Spirosoma endbachense]|uniref:HTH LytTR-type domain-containing protein n=1 Tax=Spirosoma endbachense TaxID=2666025 RepID=A0A6P1W281_9BACT|nr:LytTR family transcriptional regulator DNA-binding domain-containing protein [Spirosoma endbachense]QHV99531.1 hypothetical protein GJR95_32975 [Spirosoma endbachense]
MKQKEIVSNLAVITHLTGASNYTWVYFKDRPRLLVSKSLTYFEKLLPSCIRIHKTALINPAYIQDITPPLRAKAPGSITMVGGTLLPISRRRWLEVADSLHASNTTHDETNGTEGLREEPVEMNGKSQVGRAKQGIELPERFVYTFMQDERKRQLLAEIISEKCPHYTIQFFESSTSLIGQLPQTVPESLPALVLLEVRTVGWALLNTLEFIKTDNRFRQIPTVVFLREQSGNDVEICYAAGANSVVCETNYVAFTEATERICRYWLTFAALPIDKVMSSK